MLSDRCLSVCLSVTLVYCGRTVGWIKMKLGTEVGHGLGHIVLDNDRAPPPQKGTQHTPSIFGPHLLWPNGWMDQDATWYGGVRWGLSSPNKGEAQQPPLFGLCIVVKRLDRLRCHLLLR